MVHHLYAIIDLVFEYFCTDSGQSVAIFVVKRFNNGLSRSIYYKNSVLCINVTLSGFQWKAPIVLVTFLNQNYLLFATTLYTI